jgi:hypothetical protein
LDVHARSVVACGLDGRTGELFERRLTPDHGDVVSWIRSLPGPVAVTYEAGPTGFGLAQRPTGQGIECLVAAPLRLQRPSGDRIKTDVRDARHLARCCIWIRSSRSRCRVWNRKTPGIWCGPAWGASLEYVELVAQDQDLDVLRGIGPGEQDQPGQDSGEHQVDQLERHRGIMPGASR